MSVFKISSSVGEVINDILKTIFKNDSILKMIVSIENFKISKTSTPFLDNLNTIIDIITDKYSSSGSSSGVTFNKKYQTIKVNSLNEIKRIFNFEESNVLSSKLFLNHVRLLVALEFSLTYQRLNVEKIIIKHSNGTTNDKILNNLNSLYQLSPIKNFTVFENSNINFKPPIPFTFNYNGLDYTVPVLSLNDDDDDDDENISLVIQSFFNKVKLLYFQTKENKQHEFDMHHLIIKFKNLSISSFDDVDGSGSDNLFKEIFNSDNIEIVKSNIINLIRLHPNYNLKLLLGIVNNNEIPIACLVDKCRNNTLKISKFLKSEIGYDQFLNKYLSFVIMIKVGFIYSKIQSNSMWKKLYSTSKDSGKIKKNIEKKIQKEQNIVTLDEIANCTDPNSFRRILSDLSFNINSNNYEIECLKYGNNNNISNTIQTTFIEIHSIFNDILEKQKQKQRQQQQINSTIDLVTPPPPLSLPLPLPLPTQKLQLKQPNILFKIFNSINEFEDINKLLDFMIKIYPTISNSLSIIKDLIYKMQPKITGTKKHTIFDYLIGGNKLLENTILNKFISLRLIIKFNFLYQKDRLSQSLLELNMDPSEISNIIHNIQNGQKIISFDSIINESKSESEIISDCIFQYGDSKIVIPIFKLLNNNESDDNTIQEECISSVAFSIYNEIKELYSKYSASSEQISSSSSSRDKPISENDNKDCEVVNQDDSKEEKNENNNEQKKTINKMIYEKSFRIYDNYPIIILDILNQLYSIKSLGEIDSNVILNKKILINNFNTCGCKLSVYINKILKSSNISKINNNDNFSKISNELLEIKSNIECKNINKIAKQESFNRLKMVLLNGFPTSALDIFGSYACDLSLNDSDLDIIFTIKEAIGQNDKSLLDQVSNYLNKTGQYKIREKRFEAKVPIIRFTDLNTGINYDMCNSPLGQHNSLFLYEYVSIDSRVKDLILLVKWWAINKDLNDASMETLSSFCIVNMVIHFLQQLSPPILPNIQNPSINHYDKENPNDFKLKSNILIENYLIKYYDHTTLSKFNSNLNTLNIGQLFYKFFYYYSTFNYDQYAISITYGVYRKPKPAFEHYKVSNFVFQDPFITNKNIAFSLKPMKFNNYLMEIILMECLLRNFNNLSLDGVNEVFSKVISLSSLNLNVPNKR